MCVHLCARVCACSVGVWVYAVGLIGRPLGLTHHNRPANPHQPTQRDREQIQKCASAGRGTHMDRDDHIDKHTTNTRRKSLPDEMHNHARHSPELAPSLCALQPMPERRCCGSRQRSRHFRDTSTRHSQDTSVTFPQRLQKTKHLHETLTQNTSAQAPLPRRLQVDALRGGHGERLVGIRGGEVREGREGRREGRR